MTQCIIKKKPVLCAFDAVTGTAVENKNIGLTHPMFEGGWWKEERRPLLYNSRLYYLTQDDNYDIHLVVVDLNVGKEISVQPIMQKVRFDYSNFKLVTDNNKLHIIVDAPELTASLDLDSLDLIIDDSYEFFGKSYYTLTEITNDKLYVNYNSNEDFASVDIYSRTDKSLIQTIKLPDQSERNTMKTIICESGIIYTYRYFKKDDKVYIELCLIV